MRVAWDVVCGPRRRVAVPPRQVAGSLPIEALAYGLVSWSLPRLVATGGIKFAPGSRPRQNHTTRAGCVSLTSSQRQTQINAKISRLSAVLTRLCTVAPNRTSSHPNNARAVGSLSDLLLLRCGPIGGVTVARNDDSVIALVRLECQLLERLELLRVLSDIDHFSAHDW